MPMSEAHEFGIYDAARLMPVPDAHANKYSRGKLVVVGGSASYPAAPVMSALAAGRVGAGYTSLAVPQSAAGVAHAHVLSITVNSLPDIEGAFCAQSVKAAQESLAKAAASVVGPGMGRSGNASAFLRGFLASDAACAIPGVVDADALALIASWDGGFAEMRPAAAPSLVLTPHAGEAARLLGEGRRVQDPLADVLELSRSYNSVVALKGPDTFIASPDGEVRVVRAGAGDVLAGTIGALLAQGLDAFDAACLGVYLHAKAGAIAAAQDGVTSVMPEDLFCSLPKAIRGLEACGGKLAAAQQDAQRRSTL